MRVPIIDPEFSSLIPPLQEDERTQLEASIAAEGCRDALITWAETGILLDGHNRLEICERLAVPYEIRAINFADRDAAIEWIIRNQLGRRNLAPDAASYLRGLLYNREKLRHGGARKASAQSGHLKTCESLAEKHGVSKNTIKRDGQFAAAVETLKPHMPDIQQRVLSGDIRDRQTVIAAAKTPEKAVTMLAERVVHVSQNSGNNEWYTPPEYIEIARAIMGEIDCDPASSEIANRIVRASVFYSIEDDGLKQKWGKRVWMNPPYGQPFISDFSEAICSRIESGEVKQACVLVNNATETAWFQRMLKCAAAVCLIRGRIRYLDAEGEPANAPLQGQVMIYFGDGISAFRREAEAVGTVLVK